MERRNFLKGCVVAVTAGSMIVSNTEAGRMNLKLGSGEDRIELKDVMAGDEVTIFDVTAVPFGGAPERIFSTKINTVGNYSLPKALGEFTGGKVMIKVKNNNMNPVKFIGTIPVQLDIIR